MCALPRTPNLDTAKKKYLKLLNRKRSVVEWAEPGYEEHYILFYRWRILRDSLISVTRVTFFSFLITVWNY